VNCAALLVIYPVLFLRLKFTRRGSNESQKERKELARGLLFYPLLYILCTLTLSIVRLADIEGHEWSQIVYFIGASLYACEGWCNVLLYTTRDGVISWSWLGWRNHIYEILEAYHPTSQGRKYRYGEPLLFAGRTAVLDDEQDENYIPLTESTGRRARSTEMFG
jgi:hypothetical protein